MPQYEYTLRPAPTRAEKHRTLKTNADKFAQTLTDAINELAREGWEFQGVEALPADERSGLTSRTTVIHNLMVFRREKPASKQQATLTATGDAMQIANANGPVTTSESAKPVARSLSTASNEGLAPRLGPAE
ncbi:DUF4177 domain-containing protein [Albirhodobacter sp. R86504]|jgi:hypothetical protein|uniref:DUF4177 domain-containing protein n=1 Tax=Albirhodobacter sp. R86504 TaxID=3093848 RepID=UPI00366EE5CD